MTRTSSSLRSACSTSSEMECCGATMGKRDTYREHIDWADVERAYAEQRHEQDMRDLMMPERGVIVDECRWGRQ